jgi:hypothetical protein
VVVTDVTLDSHCEARLLPHLATQADFVAFSRVDVATRKLPALEIAPNGQQNPIPIADDGLHHHQGLALDPG